MPRVGSKHSMVCTPPATQRAIVTFCWLPPDRRRTSPRARESICSLRDRGVDLRRLSPEVDRAPAPEPAPTTAARCSRGPSAASAAPRRGRRPRTRDRPGSRRRGGGRTTGEPSTSSSPPLGRAAPARMSNSSSWPWPSSAATPEDLARIEVERDVLELRPLARGRARPGGAWRWPPAAGPSCGSETAGGWSTIPPSISSTIRSSEPSVTSTTPTVSPSRSTVARSQMAAISIIRWEMKMMDRSPPFWRPTTDRTRSVRFAGSAAVISSSIGRRARSRARGRGR